LEIVRFGETICFQYLGKMNKGAPHFCSLHAQLFMTSRYTSHEWTSL